MSTQIKKREKVPGERNISWDKQKKLYYVCFNYGKNPDTGTQEKVYKTYTKLKEAKWARDLHEAERKAAKLKKEEFRAPQKLTLEGAIEQYFTLEKRGDNKLEEATIDAYKRIFDKHFLPFCRSIGKSYARDLGRTDFQKYFIMLTENKKLSGETRRKHYTVLKCLYCMLQKNGVIKDNPVLLVDKPKRGKLPPKNICSPKEAADMIAAFAGDKIELAILLGLYMGLRREEIAGLKWENVNLDERYISIVSVRTSIGGRVVEKQPKTDSSVRKLYIPDRVLNHLQQVKAEQSENKALLGESYEDSGYVITDTDGRPFHPGYYYQHAMLMQKKHGLRHVSMHDLRKTFATMAYQESNDIMSIKEALGHLTKGVTEVHYIGVLDTHSKKVIKAVERAYEKAIGDVKKKGRAA